MGVTAVNHMYMHVETITSTQYTTFLDFPLSSIPFLFPPFLYSADKLTPPFHSSFLHSSSADKLAAARNLFLEHSVSDARTSTFKLRMLSHR